MKYKWRKLCTIFNKEFVLKKSSNLSGSATEEEYVFNCEFFNSMKFIAESIGNVDLLFMQSTKSEVHPIHKKQEMMRPNNLVRSCDQSESSNSLDQSTSRPSSLTVTTMQREQNMAEEWLKSEHMHFFASLLPTFKKFDGFYTLRFRDQVLRLAWDTAFPHEQLCNYLNQPNSSTTLKDINISSPKKNIRKSK